MKKQILLGLVVIAQAGISMAQTGQQLRINTLNTSAPKATTNLGAEEKALGTTFYYDNFDSVVVNGGTTGVPSAWTINNSGQTLPGFGWTIDNVSDGWWSAATGIQSTSEGKFAEVSNGDPTLANPSQALGVTYTLTTPTAIDIQTLAGTDKVTLSFQQYGARFNDLQAIQISTDNGATWVTVGDNLDKTVLSNTGGAAYANPDTKSINLAPFIAGNASAVLIRFMWTTNYPTEATNPNVWVTYGWYIDDLKLTTNPDDEVKVNEMFIGDILGDYSYSIIPVAQTTPMIVGVSLTNNGISNFTNQPINVSIKLNGTEVDNFNEMVTLNSGIKDTFWITSTYTPTTVGNYTVDVSIPADDILTNNTATGTVTTSNYVWAHDFGGAISRGFNQDEETALGNIFLINDEQIITGLNIKFRTGTTVGQEVELGVYDVSAGVQQPQIFVTEEYYTIVSSDITAPYTTVQFSSPAVLEVGKSYLVYVKKAAGTSRLYVSGTDAGNNDFGSAIYGPFASGNAINWFTDVDYATYVRANFDPSLAIKNVSMLDGISVYPNPSEGIITITNDNNIENTITVFDVTGKQVASKVASSTTTVDLSTMGTGVYMVEVSNENGNKLERVIIK